MYIFNANTRPIRLDKRSITGRLNGPRNGAIKIQDSFRGWSETKRNSISADDTKRVDKAANGWTVSTLGRCFVESFEDGAIKWRVLKIETDKREGDGDYFHLIRVNPCFTCTFEDMKEALSEVIERILPRYLRPDKVRFTRRRRFDSSIT